MNKFLTRSLCISCVRTCYITLSRRHLGGFESCSLSRQFRGRLDHAHRTASCAGKHVGKQAKKGGGNCRIFGRWRFFCFLLSIFVLIILSRPWCDESDLSRALGRVLLMSLQPLELRDGEHAPDRSCIGIIPVCFVFIVPGHCRTLDPARM